MDRQTINNVFEQHKSDAVMHLAAESHVGRCIDGPAEFIQTNIFVTSNLLEAARMYWFRLEGEAKSRFRSRCFNG